MAKFIGMAGVGIAAMVAVAAPSVVQAQTATGSGTPKNEFDGISGEFGSNNVGSGTSNNANQNGAFANTFTFTLARAGTANATITSTGTGASSLNFTRVRLTGPGVSGTAGDFANVQTGVTEFRTFSGLLNPGIFSLSVTGRAGSQADFTGVFSFAAVPEPASWALMIGGVGIAGAALRRRRTAKLAFA